MKIQEPIKQIHAEQLDELLKRKTHRIIDVRPPEAISTQGSIPGAINLPHDVIDTEYEKFARGQNNYFNTDKPLLFCCTGGVMSYSAALKIRDKGVEEVCNLEGGHSAWKKLRSEFQDHMPSVLPG